MLFNLVWSFPSCSQVFSLVVRGAGVPVATEIVIQKLAEVHQSPFNHPSQTPQEAKISSGTSLENGLKEYFTLTQRYQKMMRHKQDFLVVLTLQLQQMVVHLLYRELWPLNNAVIIYYVL